jgi:carboxypeptidase C (cathepsin A)
MTHYTIAAQNDRVYSLPRAPPIVSNQFSGHLNISTTKYLHYYYFESERDPENDIVIFWTNGGPGCSGLLGLFTGAILSSTIINILKI